MVILYERYGDLAFYRSMLPTGFRIWSTILAMLGQLLVAPSIASSVLLLLFNPVVCAMPTHGRRNTAISDGRSGQSNQFIIVGAGKFLLRYLSRSWAPMLALCPL